MKTVITGGTSFIGINLINKLSLLGWELFVVIRPSSNKRAELEKIGNVHIIELDMDNYSKLADFVHDADCLVALAWDGTRGQERNNRQKQEKNYAVNKELINDFLLSGCKNIVLAGSQAEYGNWCHDIINEETECKPNTEYGKYKLKLFEESAVLCDKYHARLLEPRFFSIYGPGDYQNTMIMSLINQLSKNEDVNVTAATQVWDYVYLDDAVRAVIELIVSNCSGGAYNIASGEHRILRNYIEEIEQIMKSTGRVNYGAVPYPETGPIDLKPSIDKIIHETGWRPKTAFSEGIKAILRNRGELDER